jgi:hypothetical protein
MGAKSDLQEAQLTIFGGQLTIAEAACAAIDANWGE